jgi:hypothetical protein
MGESRGPLEDLESLRSLEDPGFTVFQMNL